MSFTEGSLVIVIVIMTFVFIYNDKLRKTLHNFGGGKAPTEDDEEPAVPSVEKKESLTNYYNPKFEQKLLSNNLQYYTEKLSNNDCHKCDNNDIDYTVNLYGDGESYKDWVASQAVETSVYNSHDKFVADRHKNKGQNITGKTYMFGDIQGNDLVPWEGFRRPRVLPASAMAGSLQVPEVDRNTYATKDVFNI